ncbi:MAG: molybdopterin dinucleotide binding domain-containing protein, partial [Candidatus Xenobia bacterium]
SNGSLMTAPDMRGRLRAIQARGGKVVVLDPRRTRTAQEATEHHFIRPGTDAYVLFAIVHTLFHEGWVRPGRLRDHLRGLDRIAEMARSFSPRDVSHRCGLRASVIHDLARDLTQAPRAVVYGRLGTCTQRFGTLASWLVDVINILTGNLDREGGAMFPCAPAGARNTVGIPGKGPGVPTPRVFSRVRKLPQLFGELPTATLADEILVPGEGRVRALITVAGNPVLSAPHSNRLADALQQIDFMVSVDPYRNETTRFANVILPPPGPLERPHYDLVFTQLAVRNVARYHAAVLPLSPDQPDEWEILLRLAAIAGGQGPDVKLPLFDAMVAKQVIERELATLGSRIFGQSCEAILAMLHPRVGPPRLLDFLLRCGPYGDAFGANPQGLTLEALEASPHGIDLGPLRPRVPEILRTPSGCIELTAPMLEHDVARLEADLTAAVPEMVLIGRRELRSNNSWMHNLPALVKGPEACRLLIHPRDASAHGLSDGSTARVVSSVGSIEVTVRVTDEIMPGVCSIPHGWGHGAPGTSLQVAAAHAGENVNRLVPDGEVEPLSGNAIQNAVAVTVRTVETDQ